MATLFSNLSSGKSPTMLYTVTANETSRNGSSATFSVKVSARLESQTYDFFNARVNPKIKIGNVTKSFSSLGPFPKGAGTKSDTISITVTGLSATTSSVSYTFSATSQLGGTSSSTTGYVGGKSGTVSVSKYATTPSLSGSVTIKDGSTTVSSFYRENIGSGSFSLSWPRQSGGNGTIAYQLERSTNGGGWTNVSTPSGTSASHAPGASTTSMRYRVRARNTVGSDTLYSGWIYSPTVKKNSMSSPSITSSATVNYNSKSFTINIRAASDDLKSSMTYTLSGTNHTILNGSGSSSPGNVTINTNNGTSGWYITLANLKKAALGNTTHSDSNGYKGNLEFQISARNAYGTTKTGTIKVAIDLGKDAPISGTPSVSINSSYYSISSTNYIFPEYKPLTLTIPARIQDALGRNCSFDIIMKEGTKESVIKNTGIITATTATNIAISHSEIGLGTSKKNASFYIKAKTDGNQTKSSNATAAVDLHYYKRPTVATKSMSRLQGSVTFSTTVTSNSSLAGATNTVTLPSGWIKGTSSKTGQTETFSVSRSGLADTYTAKISIVIRDSIGYVLAGSNDITLEVTIPKYTPALSIREKGIGINTYATDSEALKIGGNLSIHAANVAGSQGVIRFDSDYFQGVQLRYNSHDTLKAPYGLHLERTPENTQTGFEPYLVVNGEVEIGRTLRINSPTGRGYLETTYSGSDRRITIVGFDPDEDASIKQLLLQIGSIQVGPNQYLAVDGGLNMNNSDITRANSIWFNDESTGSEGLNFLKTGKPAGSKLWSDYDTFRVLDGTGFLNDKAIFTSDQSVLWTGKQWPNAATTITPKKKLSDCPNGWVFVWSDYDAPDGKLNDFHFVYSFVLKEHISEGWNGQGMYHTVPTTEKIVEYKYLYIWDDKIVGHSVNTTTISGSGASDAVLRAVISF